MNDPWLFMALWLALTVGSFLIALGMYRSLGWAVDRIDGWRRHRRHRRDRKMAKEG